MYECTSVSAGSEEYLDSEKYQLRPRDFAGALAAGRSLAPTITRLNAIRRAHPALHRLQNLRFHAINSDAITVFSKRDAASGDTILVLCSTDPHRPHEGWTSLDMPAVGLGWNDRATVRDLLTGEEYDWGQFNFVRLDPSRPAHIFQVHPIHSTAPNVASLAPPSRKVGMDDRGSRLRGK